MFEHIMINNIYLLCRILDKITLDIRYKIIESFQGLNQIKQVDNFVYVYLYSFLLISPQYVVNRLWILFLDRISGILPVFDRSMDRNIFMAGTMGLIGINNIEVMESSDNQRVIVEKIGNRWIRYCVKDDNLVIQGIQDNMKSLPLNQNIISMVDKNVLKRYTDNLLEMNINRLSFINSKIHIIATCSLPFDHPLMQFIRIMCRDTMYDRIVFSPFSQNAKNDKSLEQSDLSSLHRFTRSFYVDDELMSNFHLYKYCQQMQRILAVFVEKFCAKHQDKINKNKDVDAFIKKVSDTFRYDERDEDSSQVTNDYTLCIDDVLIAIIFNVIEYSMNRIFIETYWEYQGSFPVKAGASNHNIKTIISRSNYGVFMHQSMDEIVGKTNREELINAMTVLYSRLRADSAPFVECIDPCKMKSCVLAV